jgi:prevent-host-death family protein
MQTIPLAEFESHCSTFVRQVEKAGESLVITEEGHPIARVVPYSESECREQTLKVLAELRGSVLAYEEPTEPVGEEDWETLKC